MYKCREKYPSGIASSGHHSPADAVIMTRIRALWAQTPRHQDSWDLSLSVQVIFEAVFTFKSPFFCRTQGLNSRINTMGWMSSSKFRHTKYWAIIFCSVSPSKNYPWHGLYVHQLQLL